MSELLKKIEKIPLSPGCYLFKNSRDEIIYIGKSKALRNRVRQYFQNVEAKEGKYLLLTREIHDVEIIQTDTETDALILECRLIKQHKPMYNTQLKRQKRYAYIKIDTKAVYPGFCITDQVENDGWEYFGCFYNRDDAFQTLFVINRIWQTPVCGRENFQEKRRACLNYHLKKCCAPCESQILPEEYQKKAGEIIKCLKGHSGNVLRRIGKEMKAAAREMQFEKAAALRDSIQGLEKLHRKSKRLHTILEGKDLFLFFRAFNEQRYSLFFIRNGLTLARTDFDGISMDRERMQAFLQDIRNERFDKSGGWLLTGYLLEIYADKLYVPVGKKVKEEKKVDLLEQEFLDFIRPQPYEENE